MVVCVEYISVPIYIYKYTHDECVSVTLIIMSFHLLYLSYLYRNVDYIF